MRSDEAPSVRFYPLEHVAGIGAVPRESLPVLPELVLDPRQHFGRDDVAFVVGDALARPPVFDLAVRLLRLHVVD